MKATVYKEEWGGGGAKLLFVNEQLQASRSCALTIVNDKAIIRVKINGSIPALACIMFEMYVPVIRNSYYSYIIYADLADVNSYEKKQALRCPSPKSFNCGDSLRHCSVRTGQRG